ncbi:hypothetical protein F8388_017872 [Cannabis sativa]|uniref:Uncharacterized protein n=1 Tax=Cannabis sativa TaxID=3483 RepID=A0A7J6EI66_CANSA|nr:hypothetical protein G4B88_009739 [Cannabis sativa]KAF4365306.1 hypothetical protein F8388_017872 [Cannabis sativa]
MANRNKRNILYLPIHSHMLEMKQLIQTMLEDTNSLKKLIKDMIIDHDYVNPFKSTFVQIKANLRDFDKNCFEFKKEEIQRFFSLKIKEMRKKLIGSVEIKEKVKTHWVRNRGIELSHCLIKFLWLELLMNQDEDSIFQNIDSLLEQKKNEIEISYEKSEIDQLLGLILNEILSLEVVFNYPSLYPVINKINANFVHVQDVNVMSYKKLGSQIEKLWENLELPRTESMAIGNGESIFEIKMKLLRLNYIIDIMEKDIKGVKMLEEHILLVEEVEVFEAEIGRLEKHVENLKQKVEDFGVLMECDMSP